MFEEDDSCLNGGFQAIKNAFQQQREKYINVIQSQHNKIVELTQQVETLQIENQNILFQYETLKRKLSSLTSSTLTMQDININNSDVPLLYTKIPKQNEIGVHSYTTPNKNYHSIVMNPSNKSLNIINSNSLKAKKQITSSHSFITTRTDKNNLSIHTDLNSFNNNDASIPIYHKRSHSKHNSIQQRINSLRLDSNMNSRIHNKSSIEDEIDFERKENNVYNKSIQYQKTNYFLKECKENLNASNFEKLLKVFKENKDYGDESTREMKMKVNEILKGNVKLTRMFNGIYG